MGAGFGHSTSWLRAYSANHWNDPNFVNNQFNNKMFFIDGILLAYAKTLFVYYVWFWSWRAILHNIWDIGGRY